MEKMSRHPVPLNPAFLPPATHGVLKSLLENPMKLPLHHEGNGARDYNRVRSAWRDRAARRGMRGMCALCVWRLRSHAQTFVIRQQQSVRRYMFINIRS